ncbi:hypothetical protein M422DRAFT_267808 [Sphaerobolus stellatus SS14]|uniref:Uncharacterized protein n=1 Tax=Sphaerobolus stellatus (strain SS14) TaxID=990650 RepID=A0A0C9TLB3_SPHS4|nr:hypothetical protein M422DRAFT_267808 [Sphaerobolus stellatus SS14]
MGYAEGIDVAKNTDMKAFSLDAFSACSREIKARRQDPYFFASPIFIPLYCKCMIQLQQYSGYHIFYGIHQYPKTKSEPMHNDMCLLSIMIVVWIREVREEEENRLADEDGEGVEALVGSCLTKKRIW